MSLTTHILSISLPVADQDEAIRFYTGVLGFEIRRDEDGLPGSRLVEVAPVGSPVGLVLLPPDSEIPIAVRLATSDADVAHEQVSISEATLWNADVLQLDDAPPMFAFSDPDGNTLVYLQVD